MAIEIPNGSVAAYYTDLTTGPSLSVTPDNVLAAINGELIIDGLTIAKSSVGLSGLLYALTQEFTATLQIANQSGQELDDSDLDSQFRDACAAVGEQFGGIQVNAGSVLSVTGTPGGVNSGTGTQGNATTITAAGAAQGVGQKPAGAVYQCGDPTWGFFTDPLGSNGPSTASQWLTCLTQKGLTTVGLIAIGLLIGIVLIVASQNRPKVTV